MLAVVLCVLSLGAVSAGDIAAQGQVTVVDRTYAFPSGRIDWLKDPWVGRYAPNPEWIWQLNRMGFWHSLAAAYTATRDEKYARAFARQLTDWLDQTGGIPPEKGYNGVGSAFRTIEEGLRLMGSWRVAYQTFANSPAFTSALKARFLASARAQASHLMKHYTRQNWLLMEMQGVYSFATLFPDLPESAGYRANSTRIFLDALGGQVLPDGMHDELSPDYHLVAVNCATAMFSLARSSGREAELPGDFKSLLSKMAESTIALATPGFIQPRFNDCYSIATDSIVGRIAQFFPERADFLWAATRGKKGAPPAGETASRYLPWCGFAAMRSGWSQDALYLAFDVGPLGMGHVHQDKLSFTLWKGGEELVFDDGGGHYENSPERNYALSAFDHNTLVVDGLGQYRPGLKRSSAPIEAGWRSTREADFAFGVYEEGFGPKALKLATQRREIDFDKCADEVTVTDLVKSADGEAHDYALLFQLDSTNVTIAADAKSLVADYGEGRRWRLKMTFDGADTVTLATARKSPAMAGWFVGRNNLRNHAATTVFVTRKAARDQTFVTRLKPF